jgi:ribosome recycling factor
MILKANTQKARISICKNELGRTAVYIGPFETEDSQKNIIKLIHKEQKSLKIDLSNITQEEFNLRCNF